MSARPLSLAEEQGWRRYWDGWAICIKCATHVLRVMEVAAWPVPRGYDGPIGEANPDYAKTDRCTRCGKLPPLELTERARIKPKGLHIVVTQP